MTKSKNLGPIAGCVVGIIIILIGLPMLLALTWGIPALLIYLAWTQVAMVVFPILPALSYWQILWAYLAMNTITGMLMPSVRLKEIKHMETFWNTIIKEKKDTEKKISEKAIDKMTLQMYLAKQAQDRVDDDDDENWD